MTDTPIPVLPDSHPLRGSFMATCELCGDWSAECVWAEEVLSPVELYIVCRGCFEKDNSLCRTPDRRLRKDP